MYFRSDMAQELRDRFMKEYSKEHEGEPDGIGYSQKRIFGFGVSEVDVYNENGAALLSKQIGRHVTVNAGELWHTDPDTFEACAGVISDVIRSMRRRTDGPVLAVGVPTVIDAAVLYGKDGGGDELRGFYVCPKDCDVIASVMGRLIGRAVNRMCHPGLSPGESEYI